MCRGIRAGVAVAQGFSLDGHCIIRCAENYFVARRKTYEEENDWMSWKFASEGRDNLIVQEFSFYLCGL